MAVLYLMEQGSVLRKESRRFVVEKEGKVLFEVPEFKIERVIIMGNIQLTTQAMKFLLNSGIETAFMTTTGKLIGKLSSMESKNIELRLAQFRKYEDSRSRLIIARYFVEGKIRNSKVILQKYKRNHPEVDFDQSLRELDDLLSALHRKETVSSLCGLEGRASAVYFHCFGRMFLKGFQFETRTKHPPLDPINSLLSLGYTLITNEMLSVVSSLGFDPYIGFLHGVEYGRPSLALDLIEEFRAPIIDRLTLEIINKGIIVTDDFVRTDSGVFLKEEARKKYYLQYENRMQDTFQITEEASRASYRKIFFNQAQNLASTLKTSAVYTSFLIR